MPILFFRLVLLCVNTLVICVISLDLFRLILSWESLLLPPFLPFLAKWTSDISIGVEQRYLKEGTIFMNKWEHLLLFCCSYGSLASSCPSPSSEQDSPTTYLSIWSSDLISVWLQQLSGRVAFFFFFLFSDCAESQGNWHSRSDA